MAVPFIAIAGLALSAMSMAQGMNASNAAAATAKGNLKIAAINREKIRREGQRKADLIMRDAHTTASQQVAKFAANGVVVGDGSAQAIVDETNNRAMQDALITIYNANAGMTAESIRGAQAYADGMNKSSQLKTQAFTTFLQGSMNAYGSYKNTNTGGSA